MFFIIINTKPFFNGNYLEFYRYRFEKVHLYFCQSFCAEISVFHRQLHIWNVEVTLNSQLYGTRRQGPTDFKCPPYLEKNVTWKIIKSYSDLSSGPPVLARLYIGGQDIKKIPKVAAKAV